MNIERNSNNQFEREKCLHENGWGMWYSDENLLKTEWYNQDKKIVIWVKAWGYTITC
jgi:hypothetical protein